MKQRNAIVAVAAGLLFFFGVSVQAGVVFTIEEIEGETTSTSHLRAQDGLLAIAVEGAEQDGEMIFRTDRQEMVAIDHSQKTYLVFDQAMLDELTAKMKAVRAQMEQSMANLPEAARQRMMEMQRSGQIPGMPSFDAPPAPPEIRRSDDTEELYGYTCRKIEMVRDGRVVREFWVTDWDNVTGGGELETVFKAMAEFASNMAESMGSMGTQMVDDGLASLKSIDGFPVVTREFDEQGQLRSESVLKSAEEQMLDPASFDPPSDYRQQSMGF